VFVPYEGYITQGHSPLTLIFKAKGKSLNCEEESFEFRGGSVESNGEPTDTLRISPETGEGTCATPDKPPPGGFHELEAILAQETRAWIITASSTGKSEVRAETGNIKMVLYIYTPASEGHPSLECHFEKSALNGANNATPTEEPLTISFGAAKNKLLLNKATSPHGCPTAIKVGFAVRPIPYEGSLHFEPRLREHIHPAEPAFSIEKLQEVAGSGGGFTKSKLSTKVGETINYEVVVTNTGNVGLHFSTLGDEHCEAITGGPGKNPLPPEEGSKSSATYRCQHTLTAQDLVAGSYSNSASDTGTPPQGGGSPVTHTSNTVVVEVQSH
jgi:hypothetical protein